MHKQAFGRIINIVSVHGLVGSVNKAAYLAAKHGVVGLTKGVALENASQQDCNITCNAICPGWVLTDLIKKQIEQMAHKEGISIDEAQERLVGEKQPNKRFATVEDIAGMVVHLSNPEFRAMTGSTVVIDGGWTGQ